MNYWDYPEKKCLCQFLCGGHYFFVLSDGHTQADIWDTAKEYAVTNISKRKVNWINTVDLSPDVYDDILSSNNFDVGVE